MSIPPIHFTLHHLLQSATAHLAWLPPHCALQNPDHVCQVTLVPFFFPTPPMLPTLPTIDGVESYNPPKSCPYIPLPYPTTPTWSHTRFTIYPKTVNQQDRTALQHPTALKIFIQHSPFHIPHTLLTLFSIFKNDTLYASDFCLDTSACGSLMLTFISALC
jgi:hypothetical protein